VSSAIETLTQCFARPLERARAARAAGASVAGMMAHAVPWEILRAAGLSPVVVRPTRQPAHFSDDYLEPGVFSPRIRSLFESALAGDLRFLSVLVCARTSEQDYKAYLYLREAAREGHALPALEFYDLLYTPSAHAYQYGLMRTRDLAERIGALSGHAIEAADLHAAVTESNAARAAVRRLLALRRPVPRLTGVEALALTGSFFLMDRGEYAVLAGDAAGEAEARAPLVGPRIVLAGAWLDDDRLHALVEAQGAVVVGEEGGWGSRGAGRDIACGQDPVAAIFDKYYRDGPSVRQFDIGTSWLCDAAASDVEGVIFYLPPDDSIAGWDVPRQREQLAARGIPSLIVRDDVGDPGMADRWRGSIAEFVQQLDRRP
jgi:benzoyl-CoA reductase/2-hydroxyglutaryl-CoA dehydratase subunit BcrC/BadD/HgdB